MQNAPDPAGELLAAVLEVLGIPRPPPSAGGMTAAVHTAVAIVAGTYQAAWEAGRCPDGVRPAITRYWIGR